MRQKSIVISPTAADRDGISAAQQLAAAGDMLLNGALSAGYDRNGLVTATTPAAAGTVAMTGALKTSATLTTLSSAQYIIIYSDGDDSGVTFTLTGTDFQGNVQYETVTGPNTTATSSTKKFLTVTNIYISGAGTGSIEVGAMGVGTLADVGHVSIYCGGDMSGVTFTIYGTDRFDNDISEAVTGPNATTVHSDYNFKTVTKVAASGAVGTNTEVGSSDQLESQWVPLDRYGGDVSIACTLSSGADMTYGAQVTRTNLQSAGFKEYSANAVAHGTVTGETTSQVGSITAPVCGVRLAITSFVSGTVTLEVVQARA